MSSPVNLSQYGDKIERATASAYDGARWLVVGYITSINTETRKKPDFKTIKPTKPVATCRGDTKVDKLAPPNYVTTTVTR